MDEFIDLWTYMERFSDEVRLVTIVTLAVLLLLSAAFPPLLVRAGFPHLECELPKPRNSRQHSEEGKARDLLQLIHPQK